MWQSAGPDDHRSPCPGLNSLANHDILPHNGVNITKDILINGLVNGLGLSSILATTLATQAVSAIGRPNDSGENVLDLQDLDTHNVLEHDASLTRRDAGVGDAVHVDADLVAQLKSLSSDGQSLGMKELAKARNLRYEQDKAVDPNFTFGFKQFNLAYGEAAFVFRVLGDGEVLPLSWVDDWFLNEKFPDAWNKPAGYGALQIAADIAAIKALTLVNPAELE